MVTVAGVKWMLLTSTRTCPARAGIAAADSMAMIRKTVVGRTGHVLGGIAGGPAAAGGDCGQCVGLYGLRMR